MDKELKKELLLNFHQQFAESQNHHQQSFIQVLSVILTVLIGYGYVYSNSGTFTFDEVESYDYFVALSFCIATLINSFGILLVCSNAYGFRRDQYVVSKIRREAGLFDLSSKMNSIFPNHFDPSISFKSKRDIFYDQKYSITFLIDIKYIVRWLHFKVSWMPNFYNILFFALASIQFGLLLSLIFNPNDNLTFDVSTKKKLHSEFLVALLFWLAINTYLTERLSTFMSKLSNLYNQ